MKPQRAWIVLNRNGNPPVGISDALFDDKAFATRMAKTWMSMEVSKRSPNSQLSIHRATVTVEASHSDG